MRVPSGALLHASHLPLEAGHKQDDGKEDDPNEHEGHGSCSWHGWWWSYDFILTVTENGEIKLC